MQALLLVSFVLFSVAAAVPLHKDLLAPLLGADSPDGVPDEYIVVFHPYDRVKESDVASHMQRVTEMVRAENGSRIGHTYNIGNRFRGYHAVASPRVRDWVRAQGEVKYVEQNRVVTLDQGSCVDQLDPENWGLVRTAFKVNPFDNSQAPDYSYSPEMLGDGVKVYIIDTGIEVEHDDFGGRAVWGEDFIDGEYKDLNGHGTHVAGTVTGDMFGLAKKATAVAVRVLNANGSGTFAQVIAGIDFTADEFNKDEKKVPSVANMSLGGGLDTSLLDAVEAAVKEGVVFVVAAGNSAIDACSFSPAASEFATTVGATDIEDNLAYFSNFGDCMEILAPGVSIMSAWPGNSKSILSGTSMASPHVAGVVAKYLTEFVGKDVLPTPQEVEDYIVELATDGVVKGLPDDKSPNKLLFMDCL